MAITRTFTREELDAFGLPYEGYDGAEIVSDTLKSKSRWAIEHELIFRLSDQPEGEAWKVAYSTAATEYQTEDPWGYERVIKATLVRLEERLVKVWVEA